MIGRLVERVRTPISEVEVASALRAAHVLAFGGPPKLDRWAGLWAQVALEHARGRALDCFCFGNVTAGEKWAGAYYDLECDERVSRDPDVWKRLRLHFRAFPSAVAGARSYVDLLAGRYARALGRMDVGDPAGAAIVLSTMGYYTADAGAYARAMTSLFAYARDHLLPPLFDAETPPGIFCDLPDCEGEARSILSPDELNQLAALQLATLIDLGREALDDMTRNRRHDDDE